MSSDPVPGTLVLFPRRLLVGLGLLWVVPLLWLSVLNLRDDAPDMPLAALWLMGAGQLLTVVVLASNWWRWKGGPMAALVAAFGNAAATWVAVSMNGGWPALAVLIFAGPPLLVAAVMVGAAARERGVASRLST